MWIFRELMNNERATLVFGCDVLACLLAFASISAIKAFELAPVAV